MPRAEKAFEKRKRAEIKCKNSQCHFELIGIILAFYISFLGK